MKKRCFGVLYDSGAQECQICSLVLNCYDQYSATSSVTSVRKKGEEIAILQILSKAKQMTLFELKEALTERFGEKEVNVYYYLDKLKMQGLVSVKIIGRQRFYVRR